jgi:hypothetical protein
VAHNLKSVLKTLGNEPAALVARQTENAAEKDEIAHMKQNWLLLRKLLISTQK